MPPDTPLPAGDVARLADWVRSGLVWPENSSVSAAPVSPASSFQITEEQKHFWSFQPVRLTPPPVGRDDAWVKSFIDRYVLASLTAHGLKPARQADKCTLIRRATFDLTGLPPAPQEVAAFLADDSPDAYERLIDRLLASPHYGERWARHWLDVVRYTDSFDARIVTGAGSIMDCSDAYRYRDWVVNAFNDDLPYDQFVVHQIAGDLLPAKTQGSINADGIVATGMLAIGNWGGGDADKEKLITDIADDQVDVVSRAFLGLTVACARCHDHKFDPISTEDYYSLAGIFFSSHILQDPGPKTNGPPMLRIPLVPQAEVDKRKHIEERIAALEKKVKEIGEQERAELNDLKRKAARPLPYANGCVEGGCPLSSQAGIHDVRVHVRGKYDRLGKLAPRRFPRIIAGDSQPKIAQGSGRLELARWIANRSNPLTARVFVNRVWQHHFGEGLVRTPGNFGKLGQPPSHPELLDYLAKTFMDSGWSIKQLHKAIMLSSTYQQGSIPSKGTLEADPENRWLGRMARRRLEAEEIRDSLLSAAGRLQQPLGGPASQDPQCSRRTLYVMTIRSDRSSFRELFDAADPTAIADRRVVSTVAPQALYLMNNPFVTAQVNALASRMATRERDPARRIDQAYALLYGRPPSPIELQLGIDYLGKEQANWNAYCQVLVCANEFVTID
jgi:hypothetical protein